MHKRWRSSFKYCNKSIWSNSIPQSKPNQIWLTRVWKLRGTSEENLCVDTHVCVVGFHAVDLDSASVNDLFIPSQVGLMIGFLGICSVLFVVPPNLMNEKKSPSF